VCWVLRKGIVSVLVVALLLVLGVPLFAGAQDTAVCGDLLCQEGESVNNCFIDWFVAVSAKYTIF